MLLLSSIGRTAAVATNIVGCIWTRDAFVILLSAGLVVCVSGECKSQTSCCHAMRLCQHGACIVHFVSAGGCTSRSADAFSQLQRSTSNGTLLSWTRVLHRIADEDGNKFLIVAIAATVAEQVHRGGVSSRLARSWRAAVGARSVGGVATTVLFLFRDAPVFLNVDR